MNRFLFAAIPCLFTSVLSAQPNTNWTEVNLAVTDTHVIPAYEKFATAASMLASEAEDFCAAISADKLTSLQQSFHGAMDGWQGVQHVQFGPITYFNWNFRIQFWPDEKGTGDRQLTALIAAKDPAVLATDAFDRQSVGVQGFQALEDLLFDETSLADLQADPYRCQVMQTIAANIGEIATGVHTRWVDEFRATVETADERGFFESAEDATIDFLKAQIEPIRRLQEQKLLAALGDNPAAARVRRAESWRSDRSLRNLKINVDALAHLFTSSTPTLASVLLPEDVPGIEEAFAKVQASLAAQPDSMSVALEAEGGHAALMQIHAELDAVYEAIEAALKKTDLYLGFNSLDGD